LRKPEGGFSSKPIIVALGVDGDYFMKTEGNGGAWLLSNYRELKQIIDTGKNQDGGFASIHNLVLNPYRLQSCVLQLKGGQVGGVNIPPHAQDSFDSIAKAVEDDTLVRTQRLQKLEEEKLAKLRATQQLVSLQQQQALARQAAMLEQMRRNQRNQINQMNQMMAMTSMMTMMNLALNGNNWN
jgi:hypothetical protein